MPSRKYTCPRCHLAFVSRKSPRNIRCPACGATLPPPEDWKERHTLTVFGWLMRAGVGTLAVLASPVLLLTNALSASGAADEGGGKTTAAERREIGLGIVVLLFIGFVAACVTFMVRAMKEEPDPEPVVQKMKSGQQPAPQPAPPPPQTAEAPQQQTGVPVIDQLHAEKAPDLTLVLEQVQNRYDLPGTG